MSKKMKSILASILLGVLIGSVAGASFLCTKKEREAQKLLYLMKQAEQMEVQAQEAPKEETIESAEKLNNYIPLDMFPDGMFNDKYTIKQVYLLAAMVKAEVGDGSDEEQRDCASVAINRVILPDYPDNIEDVIYQKKPTLQYQCTVNGALEKYLKVYNGNYDNISDEELEEMERCFENVLFVLENGPTLPEYCDGQAEFVQGSGVYKTYPNSNTVISVAEGYVKVGDNEWIKKGE